MVRSINLVTGKFQIKSLNRIPLNPKSYGIFSKDRRNLQEKLVYPSSTCYCQHQEKRESDLSEEETTSFEGSGEQFSLTCKKSTMKSRRFKEIVLVVEFFNPLSFSNLILQF